MPRYRPHDLLRIDPDALTSQPSWVELTQYVVVRRGPVTDNSIPVGIRGPRRNQRWAAFCHPTSVQAILTPAQLRNQTIPNSRAEDAPAFRLLESLKTRWTDPHLIWGPAGSVGFELATGLPTVKPDSDLDIVIYSDAPMTVNEANLLCQHAENADIRVETPLCGFSLREYARESPSKILLRTPTGPVLGADPWNAR